MPWTVIVALKSLADAKSRLRPASDSAAAHRELVAAIRADTLDAIRAAEQVTRVVVVSDRTGPNVDLEQTQPGLNAAFLEGAAWARAGGTARAGSPARAGGAAGAGGREAVAAVVGDLAALRPGDLDAVLRAAAGVARGFVADADGLGTTILTAGPGEPLRPEFGPDSARRHALTMTALAADQRARSDIDTAEDLRRAGELGLGPHTRALLERRGLNRAQCTATS